MIEIAPRILTTGTTNIEAGKRRLELVLSTDFEGTVNGTALTGAPDADIPLATYRPPDPPLGETYGTIKIVITAGSALLTAY